MTDLWPEDIGSTSLTAPVAILRQQASLLGGKTKNLVEAEVRIAQAIPDRYAFGYVFLIKAPALSYYKYRLFSIYCTTTLYPLVIEAEPKIIEEIVGAPRYGGTSSGVRVESEDQFLEVLGQILCSDRTRQIIHGLMAQIEGVAEEPLAADEEELPF